MNESVNYTGVCRTAPATPGLLIRSMEHLFISHPNKIINIYIYIITIFGSSSSSLSVVP